MKAITLAAVQGQKIWNITKDNLDLALAEINLHPDTEQEIRNSVNNGKVVTTHEQQLNVNGWIGAGYIILDPETGAGAYKIAGGNNGGFVDAIFAVVAGLLGYVDGSLEYLSKTKDVWFSNNLKHLTHLAKLSSQVGVVGLLAGIVNSINSGATGWNLVGQIMVGILSFAVTVVAVAAIAAASGPFLGAILGAMVSVAITMLMTRFSQLYFS